MITDGDVLPCYMDSSSSDAVDNIVQGTLELIKKATPMNYVIFLSVFSEYLYEQYKVSPVDLEILFQYVFHDVNERITRTAEMTSELIMEAFHNTENDEDSDEGAE